jgi:hypothetical protein
MKSIYNIADDIREMIDREILNVLEKISVDYGHDIVELKEKYMPSGTSVITPTGPKKRGRKKLAKEEYIETEIIMYQGKKFLVDAKGVVYTYNIESPTIVGKMLPNTGTIEFLDP